MESKMIKKRCQDLKEGQMRMISEIKEVNRKVVVDVLEKTRASKNVNFIPALEVWKAIEVRKVRERISSVEKSLSEQVEEALKE